MVVTLTWDIMWVIPSILKSLDILAEVVVVLVSLSYGLSDCNVPGHQQRMCLVK